MEKMLRFSGVGNLIFGRREQLPYDSVLDDIGADSAHRMGVQIDTWYSSSSSRDLSTSEACARLRYDSGVGKL